MPRHSREEHYRKTGAGKLSWTTLPVSRVKTHGGSFAGVPERQPGAGWRLCRATGRFLNLLLVCAGAGERLQAATRETAKTIIGKAG